MRLKRAGGIQSQRGEIEIHPARLRVGCIEVTQDYYGVRKIVGGLAVTDHRGIIGLMKSEIRVALQSGTLAAEPVDARNQMPQAAGTIQIPVLQLVLFR